MKGKIVLITGGNAGIGKATAIALAKMGAEIVIACRDQIKGEMAVAAIQKASGQNKISLLHLDLADLSSVKKAAAEFSSHWPHLDVLINNAGIYSSSYFATVDGFEAQFGTNHLGHYLLTLLLTPTFEKAPEPRVINVSSIAYLSGKLDFRRLREWPGVYRGMDAYSQSKLANVLFTREFARRYPSITCNCLHPGVVSTNIAMKKGNFLIRLIWRLYNPFMLSEERGAQTSIFLASAPEAGNVTGRYFDEHQNIRSYFSKAKSDTLSQRLWMVSEEMVQAFL